MARRVRRSPQQRCKQRGCVRRNILAHHTNDVEQGFHSRQLDRRIAVGQRLEDGRQQQVKKLCSACAPEPEHKGAGANECAYANPGRSRRLRQDCGGKRAGNVLEIAVSTVIASLVGRAQQLACASLELWNACACHLIVARVEQVPQPLCRVTLQRAGFHLAIATPDA